MSRTQDGAVLALVAMMLTVIFGMAALAVELVMYAAAVQQAKNNANLAALAAIEESTSGDKSDAETRALARATEVAGLNFILTKATESGNIEPSGREPLLEPGYWYFGKPQSSAPCGTNIGDYPCFKPKEAGDSDRPNAYRVEGELYTPIPFLFARAVFGIPSMPTNVHSVATVVPRRGCFLIDTSPSTFARDTHQLIGKTASGDDLDAAEMAFYLTDPPDNASGPLTHHNALWKNWGDNGRVTRPAGAVDPLIHYQSDYERTDVLVPGGILSDADWDDAVYGTHHPSPFSGGPTNKYSAPDKPIYRVDVFPRTSDSPATTASGDEYFGPEPFKTVFKGLNTAVKIFKERAVVGDQMCLIFYDTSVHWMEMFKLTDDFDYLDRLTDLSVTDDPNRGLLLAIKHRLFTSYVAQTDTLAAVTEAVSEFERVRAENPGMPASDFIVLMGDGLTTCQSCPPKPSPLPGDFNNDGVVDTSDQSAFNDCFNGVLPPSNCMWADSNGDSVVNGDIDDQNAFNEALNDPNNYCNFAGKNCNSHYSNYYLAWQQLKQYAYEQVYPRKIPIHVMPIGAPIQPHTLNQFDNSSSPPRCLTDYEKRAQELPAVEQQFNSSNQPFSCYADHTNRKITCDPEAVDAFANRSASTPFYQANYDLYDLAKMTGGLWAPLRPADSGCTSEEATDGRCDNTTSRISKDPYCRSPQEQMTKYMEEIMGQNPFTIVKQ